jgi:hypothetical protein
MVSYRFDSDGFAFDSCNCKRLVVSIVESV